MRAEEAAVSLQGTVDTLLVTFLAQLDGLVVHRSVRTMEMIYGMVQ